jgi:di/tricarboxylate transporter
MAPSKVLLPLSYAALYGGTWTLIGASTNLVVYSLANRAVPEMKMNLFELGIVGIPVTVAGIFYIVAFGGKLLPDRLSMSSSTINAR